MIDFAKYHQNEHSFGTLQLATIGCSLTLKHVRSSADSTCSMFSNHNNNILFFAYFAWFAIRSSNEDKYAIWKWRHIDEVHVDSEKCNQGKWMSRILDTMMWLMNLGRTNWRDGNIPLWVANGYIRNWKILWQNYRSWEAIPDAYHACQPPWSSVR